MLANDFGAGERRVFQADALAWMDANLAGAETSVVTSLPDVSEMPERGFDAWRTWFIAAAARVIRWVPSTGVAVFFQSDVRVAGAWIDKGYLVMRAAEGERAAIVWHKIVCRRPPGTVAVGRASYSHMICVSRDARPTPTRPGPDVLSDAGVMPWSRAMGVEACRVACRFLKDETDTRTVVDPFCGRGSVLAVANAMGLAAIGVDVSARRCRAARSLVLGGTPPTLDAALRRGARLFDDRAFFEAHEAWEDRWRVETDEQTRRLLQGLIQVAAAAHKLVDSADAESAARLFARALVKLDACSSEVAGVDLASFRQRIRTCLDAVVAGRFDARCLPALGASFLPR